MFPKHMRLCMPACCTCLCACLCPAVLHAAACRKLKAAAEDVLSSPWDVLYSCQMVRTSRGKGYGLLVGSYGLGWHLWSADEGGLWVMCFLGYVFCGVCCCVCV
jgi:hypothetical protein